MERLKQSYKEIAAQHGSLKVQIRELRTYLEKDRATGRVSEQSLSAFSLRGALRSHG